jgi:tyrosyl-tRNA synthetase
LIRRETGNQAFAFTIPLLTTSDGKKMGKTEKGALWIDEKKVSAYDYYQYWVNVTDEDALRFLKLFTFLPLEEIAPYEAMKGAELREVKQRLALEATAIIHGRGAAEAADAAAKAVFTGATSADMPTHESSLPELFSSLLADAGLVKSRGEARRLIQSGGIKVDYGSGKEAVTDTHGSLETEAVLWAGKKKSIRIVQG